MLSECSFDFLSMLCGRSLVALLLLAACSVAPRSLRCGWEVRGALRFLGEDSKSAVALL